jgi:hypothetical protein
LGAFQGAGIEDLILWLSFGGGRVVSVKKAKGKGKKAEKAEKAAKKPAKRSGTRANKPVDMMQVRENISNLVKKSARKIATEVIKVALTGQLATAKYLFEAVGLYPATEQTDARPLETTIAHQLLAKMGIPLEPVAEDEGGEVVAAKTAPVGRKPVASVHEDPAERDGGEGLIPEHGE